MEARKELLCCQECIPRAVGREFLQPVRWGHHAQFQPDHVRGAGKSGVDPVATARDGSAPHSSVHAGLFQRTVTPSASLGLYSLPKEAATGIQAHLTHSETEAGSRAANCSGSRMGDSELWQKPGSSILCSTGSGPELRRRCLCVFCSWLPR